MDAGAFETVYIKDEDNSDDCIEMITEPLKATQSMDLVVECDDDDPPSVQMQSDASKETMGDSLTDRVESPSTAGEAFIFKCIFCGQALSASDEPKLLECLHSGCTNCLRLKLYEGENIGSGTTANEVQPSAVSNQVQSSALNTDVVKLSGEGNSTKTAASSTVPIDSSKVECPLCQVVTPSNRLITNYFLTDQNSSFSNQHSGNGNGDSNEPKSTDQKCNECSDGIASSWCVECAEYICDPCVQAHQRLKITKDHTIKSKEDDGFGDSILNQISSAFNVAVNIFCSVHPHEKLSLFCETCDKLTCRDCQLIEHREHKYKFANEISTETRAIITNMLTDVGYKRRLLESAMTVIDDRKKKIMEKKADCTKEITQMVMKMTSSLNIRVRELMNKLGMVCDAKQKILEEKRRGLEQLANMTDYAISFTKYVLEQPNDMAFIHLKTKLTDHLGHIKSRRADIPNPDIPVRIHLSIDSLLDVCNTISNLGQIYVDGHPTMQLPKNSPVSTPPTTTPAPSPQLADPSIVTQPQSLQHASNAISRIVAPNASCTMQPSPQNVNNTSGYAVQQQTSPTYPSIRNNFPPPYSTAVTQNHAYQVRPTQETVVPHQSISTNLAIQQQQRPSLHQPTLQQPTLQQMHRIQHAQSTRSANVPNLLNQQQQHVSSSTHPQGLINYRSNLRGLLQSNNGPIPNNSGMAGTVINNTANRNSNSPVYIQTGPNQYQAVQAAAAQQYRQYVQQHQQAQQTSSAGPQSLAYRALVGPSRAGSGYQNQQFPTQQHLQQQQQNYMQQSTQLPNSVPSGGVVGGVGSGGSGAATRWYMAQSSANDTTAVPPNRCVPVPTINDNFKIHLRQQQQQYANTAAAASASAPSTAVTSTIPKTPSPGLGGGGRLSDTPERNIDKFCEDSVKDLMATIAKLDSNGVQVVAESHHHSNQHIGYQPGGQNQQQNPGGATTLLNGNNSSAAGSNAQSAAVKLAQSMRKEAGSYADSSTGDHGQKQSQHHYIKVRDVNEINSLIATGAISSNNCNNTNNLSINSSGAIGGTTTLTGNGGGTNDPNEDWCAVCMDGGELVCCDKCPKVFHQYCHIPNLSVEENDTWQCLLCTNVKDLPCDDGSSMDHGHEMSFKERRIAERIVLELYCQFDQSLPFREIIGPENVDYHTIIKYPIALDTIRQKLNWGASPPAEHYTKFEDFIRDVRLMFKNAYTYNPDDSSVYKDAEYLEKFFDGLLVKFVPQYARQSQSVEGAGGLRHVNGHGTVRDTNDDEPLPPVKRFRRIIAD